MNSVDALARFAFRHRFIDTSEVNLNRPKCLNTLFLLISHFCFIIGFFCDLSVARNDSWMSYTSTWTEQIYMFTRMEAGGEV